MQIQVCGVFNMMNRMLEGVGIDSYFQDPAMVDDEALSKMRSGTSYTEFGGINGVFE